MATKNSTKGSGSIEPPDFRALLENLFTGSFVVPGIVYNTLILDYGIIVKDRLIEVAHINGKEQYAAELAKIGRAGHITFSKHKKIREGKFVTNAFYFMAPAGVMGPGEAPPKYGLITYARSGKLTIEKEADYMAPTDYLTGSFYKTLCKQLVKQLYIN